MSRRKMLLAEKFLKIIKDNLVTVKNAELQYTDVNEVENISSEKFISDLENYANAGIFSDIIDFYYQITEDSSLIVTANDISTGCTANLSVELHLADGLDMKTVVKELRKTIFDEVAEKITDQK